MQSRSGNFEGFINRFRTLEFFRKNPNHNISRLKNLDSTIAFRKDPYRFISNTCESLSANIFETRIFFRKTICMKGAEAAALFYTSDKLSRKNAAPEPIRATLLGKGGIQGLDGGIHKRRKKLFMSFMSEESVASLRQQLKYWLSAYSRKWTLQNQVVLYDEFQEILTRAVCFWAGIPLQEDEVAQRTRDLCLMFDSAGSIGFNHLRSRMARKRSEIWISDLVKKHREGKAIIPSSSPSDVVSNFKDEDGRPLSEHVAAVEILNLLRPTVAVSVYFIFAAHALENYPEWKKRLKYDQEENLHFFVQEVRRFYPFFPAVVARVKEDFKWNGFQFSQGTQVILDLYGTNHDSREWKQAEKFCPERFKDQSPNLVNLTPQGAGDHFKNHRCPGEGIAISLMKEVLEFLLHKINYKVPDQSLELDYSRLPAIPKSRFVINEVSLEL